MFHKKHKVNTSLIALVLVLIAGGFYFYNRDSMPASEIPDVNPPITGEPEPPTNEQPPVGNNEPTGEFVSEPSADAKIFRLSNSGTGPRLIEGFLDPYETSVGDDQLFSILVRDPYVTESVSVTLKTDNGEATYPLELVNGTREQGHWQGSWEVTDTTSELFRVVITAVGGRGTSSVEWTLK